MALFSVDVWEIYLQIRSHGTGTSSPSYWQRVEEQVPKPVGWMMCFLLVTFVPVQKLCVNIPIFIYTYVFFIYMSSVIGRIYAYTMSVVQYWWSCTPSQSIGLYFGECAVPGLNATFSSSFLFFLGGGGWGWGWGWGGGGVGVGVVGCYQLCLW